METGVRRTWTEKRGSSDEAEISMLQQRDLNNVCGIM